MNEPITGPLILPKSAERSTNNTQAQLSDIREELSDMRERIAHVEATSTAFNRAIDSMRADFLLMRTELNSSIGSLQTGILNTFSRLALALILVVILSVAAISAVVGSGIYVKGFGLSVGANQHQQEQK